ncbi:MAG TPA: hypothetical protein VL588_05315 [Bdellovibrionota bacterium]|jgi:hypothetical protein|nr:hypothetical protein [Bdellovibrionota bacterium]
MKDAKVDDQDTLRSLSALEERQKIAANKVPGVRTVLVVLSAKGMVFDVEALRHRILAVYPDSAIFFRSTSGKPLGVASPQSVDLLVDFTGPGQRQGWFYSRKLRRMAKFAVGRNAGLFRKRIYDRVFDEAGPVASSLPSDFLAREGVAQREVLALGGIAVVPTASVTEDRSKTIALHLPPLAHE